LTTRISPHRHHMRASVSRPAIYCIMAAIFVLWLSFSPLLLCLAQAEPQQDAAEKPEYLLGVYPALPISQLDSLFSPIAAEIGQGIHRDIRFQSSSTYAKYSARLDKGEFDIALVHPFDYALHAEKAGYVPVVRKNEELTTVFVAPVDSPLQTMEELKGKIIAMPPEGSAVSLLAIAELTRLGLSPHSAIQVKYFGAHNSSLRSVVVKDTDAAATCRTILRIYENSLGSRLRIIGETAAVPHSLFVVHQRVPATERELIMNILLNTTLFGVPPDLRKAFVIEGKAPFVSVSGEDINRVKTNPVLSAFCLPEGKP